MVELGQGYIVRKTAAMMTVRTEVVVKDEGLHFSTKTKLKNFDSLLPWTGSSTQKGMADEPVETQMTFEGEKIIVKSQVNSQASYHEIKISKFRMSKLAQNLSTLIVNFIWKANLWLSNKQSTESLASDISKESKK